MNEFISRFLNQHNPLMPWIWRCVGICLVGNSLVSASYAAAAQPYLVPSLRSIADYLQLPESAYAAYILLWLACGACGIAMACGVRQKALPAFAATAILLLGAMEYTSILCSYIVVELLYLIALLFDSSMAQANQSDAASRGSPTPALMQVALTSCYAWSVLQKIHPEWLSGATILQVVNSGWELRSIFVPFVTSLHISQPVAAFLSVSALLFEAFLAIGLWFKRTRKLTAAAGIAFHVGLTIMFFGIDMFMPVMLTGYLAFFSKPATENASKPFNTPARAAALVFILFTALMPLRFYFTGKPTMQLTFSDRVPWSFSMFLFDEKVKNVVVKYQDDQGVWRQEPVVQRMGRASADKDLYALAAYVRDKHPEAKRVMVTSELLINAHTPVQKTCNAYRGVQGMQFFFHQKSQLGGSRLATQHQWEERR